MKTYIDNNTVLSKPTHFSRAVELIDEAHKKYTDLPTENWCFPIGQWFGDPNHDRYYAEIWMDGMDWNYVYWLIEHASLDKPVVRPLLFYPDTSDRHKLKEDGFKEICNAIMYYRRDMIWLKTGDPKGFYNDMVWPFFAPAVPEKRMKHSTFMVNYQYYHASQQKVEMFVNENLLPPYEKQSNIIKDGNITITSEFPQNPVE